AQVGMGIHVGGGPMRGPAGMADPGAAMHRLALQDTAQVRDAADALAHLEPAAIEGGQACTVITSIFEPRESFEEDSFRLPVSGVANDSTHAHSPRCKQSPS